MPLKGIKPFCRADEMFRKINGKIERGKAK